MPGPLAKGVIIAASVLVAASIAVYENPQFREWVEKSSQKVALAFKAIGDDIQGRKRSEKSDSSMHEDGDDQAEERRRQARLEIMEKGRALQEKRKRSSSHGSRTPSFDSLVDEDGKLRERSTDANPWAASSGVERVEGEGLRVRREHSQMNDNVDTPIVLGQLNAEPHTLPSAKAIEPWESHYEQEMRNAWNMEIPVERADAPSIHDSISLIDLTPTTEEFPDPDYSVPSLRDVPHSNIRSEYFSATASQNLDPLTQHVGTAQAGISNNSSLSSSHASLAGSAAHVRHSEAEMTDDDDDLSDGYGDGIRTPGSVWTEVDSSVSGDERQ